MKHTGEKKFLCYSLLGSGWAGPGACILLLSGPGSFGWVQICGNEGFRPILIQFYSTYICPGLTQKTKLVEREKGTTLVTFPDKELLLHSFQNRRQLEGGRGKGNKSTIFEMGLRAPMQKKGAFKGITFDFDTYAKKKEAFKGITFDFECIFAA